jgi:hypothetical protein
LLRENEEPAILDFFEQGASIVLSMKRKNDTIWVEFQKTPPLTGKRFDHLPEEPQPVLVRDFYEAWFQFLDEILKMLTRQEHNLETDLSNYEIGFIQIQLATEFHRINTEFCIGSNDLAYCSAWIRKSKP